MATEYTHRRRVQFYETDAAGIVHFSWFFRYMEEAEHALWRAAGLSIHPPESEFGWPRVAASFDFQRALRFEDEIDVHLRIAEMSRKTIRYECIVKKDDQQVAAGQQTGERETHGLCPQGADDARRRNSGRDRESSES